MSRKNKSKEPPRPRPSAVGELEGVPLSTRAWPQDLGLKLMVFTAGAVLMGLEIAGSRVLAPHFGNSVFVWGSLISVFLIALSVGYYVGGRLADRHPSQVLLNSICIVVSVLIFAIATYAYGFCGALVDGGLGEQSGPLVASLVLFLPPSVGMGMVSPFAIRLGTQSVSSVGKSAGTLYALSTAGSIVGTLVTTFVLVPVIGLAAILKGLGVVLLLAAVGTMPFSRALPMRIGSVALVLVAVSGMLWPASPQAGFGGEVVVEADTPYHHISVVDGPDVRQLRFDRYVESAIRKTPPYPGLESYTDYFHLAFLAKPKLERTLFIGAGGGVGPRAFHMHQPAMEIDVVDIDPKVLELARTHFFLANSPKIRTIADDGRMFVRKTDRQYDCIVLDAFTIGGRIPFHLVTREFFELCRQRLSEDGVFVMNINSAIEGPLAGIFRSLYRTMGSVFPCTYVFAKDCRELGVAHSMNVILLATKSDQPITPQQWMTRAEGHHAGSYVHAERLRDMAAELLADLPDVSAAPAFSDDYAPIETMPF